MKLKSVEYNDQSTYCLFHDDRLLCYIYKDKFIVYSYLSIVKITFIRSLNYRKFSTSTITMDLIIAGILF